MLHLPMSQMTASVFIFGATLLLGRVAIRLSHLQTFKTSGTRYNMIQPHIPEDLNILVYAKYVKEWEKANGDDSQSIPLN